MYRWECFDSVFLERDLYITAIIKISKKYSTTQKIASEPIRLWIDTHLHNQLFPAIHFWNAWILFEDTAADKDRDVQDESVARRLWTFLAHTNLTSAYAWACAELLDYT